ncbi:hypothetical protein [Aliarcobacter cryaerophilus]|uniref:hypothetical protein n=1 Tax=Aliarcobacter cryaerophilus TaxID=28198 RepID=UPI0021B2D3F9|nr:hypothetical protein [Aliarcobacter cryaerophilus]MCT7507401.1 hypothetical protein [Aliarcobacter cryaerophilus]
MNTVNKIIPKKTNREITKNNKSKYTTVEAVVPIKVGNSNETTQATVKIKSYDDDYLDKLGWRRINLNTLTKTLTKLKFNYKDLLVLDYLLERLSNINEIKTTQLQVAEDLKINEKTVKKTFQALIQNEIMIKYKARYIINPYFIAINGSKEKQDDIIFLYGFRPLTNNYDQSLNFQEEQAKEKLRIAEKIKKNAEYSLQKIEKQKYLKSNYEKELKDEISEENKDRKEKIEKNEKYLKELKKANTTRAEENEKKSKAYWDKMEKMENENI